MPIHHKMIMVRMGKIGKGVSCSGIGGGGGGAPVSCVGSHILLPPTQWHTQDFFSREVFYNWIQAVICLTSPEKVAERWEGGFGHFFFSFKKVESISRYGERVSSYTTDFYGKQASNQKWNQRGCLNPCVCTCSFPNIAILFLLSTGKKKGKICKFPRRISS